MNKIVIFLFVWIFLIMMVFADEDKAMELEKSAVNQAVLDLALSTQYVDYLHLAKFNGEWKIVNVIWEFRSDIQ